MNWLMQNKMLMIFRNDLITIDFIQNTYLILYISLNSLLFMPSVSLEIDEFSRASQIGRLLIICKKMNQFSVFAFICVLGVVTALSLDDDSRKTNDYLRWIFWIISKRFYRKKISLNFWFKIGFFWLLDSLWYVYQVHGFDVQPVEIKLIWKWIQQVEMWD